MLKSKKYLAITVVILSMLLGGCGELTQKYEDGINVGDTLYISYTGEMVWQMVVTKIDKKEKIVMVRKKGILDSDYWYIDIITFDELKYLTRYR